MVPRLLLLALFCCGCEAFDASLLDPADVGPDPGCALRLPPLRPEVDDGDDGETHVFAIREVRLTQGSGVWREIGYDLDNICSLLPDPRVECRAPAASAPPEEDGVGGIDNALGHNVLPVVLAVRDDLLPRATGGQTQGLGAILVRISGWNGEADDPRVAAVFMQTVFGSAMRLEEPLGEIDVSGGGLIIDGVDHPIPEWTGDDWFYAQADAFLDGDLERPHIVDDNAFIRDDTLVMRLPDRFPFYLGGDESGVAFALTDVRFTVSFTPDHDRVDTAILAGRWSALDILDGVESTGICPGSTDYQALERLIDLAADVRSVVGTGGAGARCDAISVGLSFEDGARANLAGIHPGFALPDPCATPRDGGMDAGDGGMDGGG